MFIEDAQDHPNDAEESNGGRGDDAPRHASRHAGARREARRSLPGRLRPKSVRAKIVAVLMVPVLSLMALWGFATVTTAGSVSEIQRFQEVNATLLTPMREVVDAVQNERSAVARHLAAPDDARIENVENAGAATDAALDELRANVNASSTEIVALADELPGHLDAFISSALDLAALRDEAIFTEVSWDAAYQQYTEVIEAAFRVDGSLANVQPSDEFSGATSSPRVVLELARARESLAQEDAYMGAAQASGEMSREHFNGIVGASATRDALISSAVDDLRPSDRAEYLKVIDSAEYQQLLEMETHIAQAGWGESALAEAPDEAWRAVVPAVTSAMLAAETRASTDAVADVSPFGLDVLGGSALAVVLGLAGVLLSLGISVQIGRGLIVDLVDLRNSAMELAGDKLPRALKRLHTGAEIDVDEEAPVHGLRGDEGEVAQVAEALTAVHRSAVQSAVERAEALNGISAVYVYLARRSQVLLHRQLALLDQMERRIDDPDELEDLFRLDHLTTRMRRLAESLIILSGATPARGWRKPVPLIDVVRAAVAEVEDFTRVDVHDLPDVRMVGSAVADLTHLFAELIENAVVFSPPHTQAHVRAELVGAGLALEIEDRGLGMSAQALRDANERIDDADQVDLLDTDQLGLFVVNRLAHRHNIRVTLQSSAYGGITAVVLVPDVLIDRRTEIDDDQSGQGDTRPDPATARTRSLPPARVAAGVPPPDPGTSTNGAAPEWTVPWAPDDATAARHERTSAGGTASANGRHSSNGASPPNGAPSSTANRRQPIGEGNSHDGRPERTIAEDHIFSGGLEPGHSESGHDEHLPEDDDGTGGLPKRVRQANLAPQLREPMVSAGPEEADDVAPQRTPDEARATMSAMRTGWLRGQDDTPAASDDELADQTTDHGPREEGV